MDPVPQGPVARLERDALPRNGLRAECLDLERFRVQPVSAPDDPRLEGKNDDLALTLTRQMEEAAAELKFEPQWIGQSPSYSYFAGNSEMRGYDYLQFAGQNIVQANARANGDGAVSTFEVEIGDVKQLNDVLRAIGQIPGVHSVERI